MITFSNVAMEFGTQELYRDVNLMIGPRDRVGLVGPNGSGKTTILRMITAEVEPTEGRVQTRKGTRIAYLPQAGVTLGDATVLEEALSAFGYLEKVHVQMLEAEQQMGEPGLDERRLKVLLDRYARLQHQYEANGYGCEARAKKVLVRLGFGQEDFGKPVKEQSGGFQVRLCLARMLLQEPDLLLLDEPTNYLDIRSIEWLQGYLAGFGGAFVMIAHDRYLLDGLVKKVWAIENHKVLASNGNYSEYLRAKEVRDEQQQKKYEEQQALVKRTQTFIARFKGRKDTAKRAMSRQKMLDKLERIESPRTGAKIRIRFPEADRVFGRAFELSGVGKRFGSEPIFSGANLAVSGGEKLGLFGPNGAGKTTLLRIIANRLRPSQGSTWWSRKTQTAYYEQGAEEELDPDLTVLETVSRVAVGYTDNELKGILGIFLFSGDAVEKRVSVLSGGERSRLAIIKVLLTPSNLLILDEPVNHLDIQSREVLFEAIAMYQRTVVFAAHDRFMLDKLADKTVRVEAGAVVLFPGNYSYACARPEHEPEPRASRAVKPPQVKPGNKPRPRNTIARTRKRLEQVRQEYEMAKDRFDLNRARELAQQQRELEAEIQWLKVEQIKESADSQEQS